MSIKKENIPKLKYRIKLLENSVILLESDNYEAEIFMPQIVNSRITLLNILPNRRCCQIAKTNVMNFATKQSNNTKTYLKEQNVVIKSRKLGRMSAGGQYSVMSAPLANSTPANVKQRSSNGSMPAQNCMNSFAYGNSTDSSLPTPEDVRRAVPVRNKLLEKSMLNLPAGIRVARIYHNSVEGTPKKVGRLVLTDRHVNGNRSSTNLSILNGSFRLPCSPSISTNNNIRRTTTSTAADSIALWQKVLTPVRTYTRKSKNPVMVRRSVSVKSVKEALKSPKIIPTYLVNPTQGPNVTLQIEMRKRKLIIDKQICISPKSFKKQQKDAVESYKTLHPNSLSLHTSHRYMKLRAMSAFDFLTNSNRHRCMTDKLNKQFRKGCVNKASATYCKYKLLCSVPQLQQDEQILELSRISLQPTRDVFDNKITSNNI